MLNYTVLRRQREIGIRIALGAAAVEVVWTVVAPKCLMLSLGGIAGLAGGVAFQRGVESLLYEVHRFDWRMMALALALSLIGAVAAALPAVMRAVRIDPVRTLRTE